MARVFFAVWPDAATRARFAGAAAGLPLAPPARWVPRDNYHVTLAFIGETDEREVAALRRLGAAQRVPRCAIRFDRREVWPQSQVLVAAAKESPPELLALAKSLRVGASSALTEGRDERMDPELPWRPHVTLARKVTQASVQPAMFVSWDVRSFSLVRSERAAASVYTVVDTWPLLDKP